MLVLKPPTIFICRMVFVCFSDTFLLFRILMDAQDHLSRPLLIVFVYIGQSKCFELKKNILSIWGKLRLEILSIVWCNNSLTVQIFKYYIICMIRKMYLWKKRLTYIFFYNFKRFEYLEENRNIPIFIFIYW